MEIYKGTKFRTVLKAELPEKGLPLEELRYWCKEFYINNLTPEYEGGSAGNLSFRIKQDNDEFIITATGIKTKDILRDESFVKVNSCDIKNMTVYATGERDPSSESMLHYSIYRQRKEVNAIFHGHSDLILKNVHKLHIPETLREAPYGSTELIDSVLEILDENKFFVIKNHGFVSLGANMKEAGERSIQVLKLLIFK